MNSREKMVKAYTKSFFKNILDNYSSVLNIDSSNERNDFENFTEEKIFIPSSWPVPVLYPFIIAEELFLLRSLFLNSEKMRIIFKNPILPQAQKMSILHKFFPTMSKKTCSFLNLLVEKSHLEYIPDISKEFNEMVLKYEKITKITLYITSPLEEKTGLEFLEVLKKLTVSKQIILNIIYSPKLLAGLILEYKSIAINTSVLNSLKRI